MSKPSNGASPSELLRQAMAGDEEALGRLLQAYRQRLRRMISLRIDRRLQGRVDPSDIIQETYVAAASRFPEYSAQPTRPFYLWLRWLATERLIDQHRHHLGYQLRDVKREFTLYRGAMPEATSAALAAQLLGRMTTPCEAAIRAEQRIRLQETLNQMDPIDREILALRHFEQLSNGDAATVLGLEKSAASKRYARAILRLKDLLGGAQS